MDSSPDFFIVGAPKCGTTSLANYLNEHPSLVISRPKEPNFFCDDLPYMRQVSSLAEYLDIFEPKVAGSDMRGEASTWYLYSRNAVDNILSFRPDSKIIAMVRNPIDLAQSLHSQFVFNLSEKETIFANAWARRGDSGRLPILNYEDVCMLGRQVKRLMLRVPADQLKILVFDDLAADAEKVHLEILKFLSVDLISLDSYTAVNRNKTNRSPLLAKIIRTKNPFFLKQLFRVKRFLGIDEIGILKRINAGNRRISVRPPLNEEIREDMISVFQTDISLLEDILQRDFSEWTRK